MSAPSRWSSRPGRPGWRRWSKGPANSSRRSWWCSPAATSTRCCCPSCCATGCPPPGGSSASAAGVPDYPGSLAGLLALLAGLGANVLEVSHERLAPSLRVDEVEVLLQVETRGPDASTSRRRSGARGTTFRAAMLGLVRAGRSGDRQIGGSNSRTITRGVRRRPPGAGSTRSGRHLVSPS